MLKEYNLIDLGKFISSIGIVALHIPPLLNLSSLSKVLSFGVSLCVPFFFAVSSFLFFTRIKSLSCSAKWRNLGKFVKRIVVLYVAWMFIQIILKPIFPWKMFDSGFFCKIVFGTTYPGSWFYSALIISTFIIFALHKYKIVTILIPFVVYCYFAVSQSGTIEPINTLYNWYNRNLDMMFLSFPYALIWTAIGWIMTLENKTKYVFFLSLLFVAFAAIPVFFNTKPLLTKGIESWILRFFFVLFLLYIVCTKTIKIKLPYKLLRKMSTLIFMIHFYFVHHMDEIGVIGGYVSVKFMVTIFLSSLIAILFIWLSEKRNFSIFKYLY